MNIKILLLNFRLCKSIEATGSLRASADVQLTYSNGKKILTIRDVKIIEGKNGLFVSMPSLKRGDRYIYTCVIDEPELLQEIQKQLLGQYMLSIGQRKGGGKQ